MFITKRKARANQFKRLIKALEPVASAAIAVIMFYFVITIIGG